MVAPAALVATFMVKSEIPAVGSIKNIDIGYRSFLLKSWSRSKLPSLF